MTASRQRKATGVRGISGTPSGKHRVQKPRFKGARGEVDRATFDTRHEAENWALACDQARRDGRPNPDPDGYRAEPSAPRGQRLTVGEFAVKFLAAKASDLDNNDTAVGAAKRWRHLGAEALGAKLLDELTTDDVRALRDTMAEAGNARTYQNTFLAQLREMFERAVEQNLRSTNPAKGVSGKEPTAPLKRPDDAEPQPVRMAQVKTIAGLLPVQHRLALWLLFVAALRISEAFGLRLRDWNARTRRLDIEQQGGRWFWVAPARRTRGKEKPKTPASNTYLILPRALAAAIDAYIDDNHGPRPGPDGPDLEAWLDRRLLVGPRTRAPAQESWRQQFDKCRDDAGLGRRHLGYKVTPHFLRKSCLTLLEAQPGVSGRAQSRWARHKVNKAEDGQAKITAEKYTLATVEGLRACADALDRLIADEIGDLTVRGRHAADDLYTVGEAAAALGANTAAVKRLLAEGRLWRAGPDAAGAWREVPGADRTTTLIPAGAVAAERARRDSGAAEEILSATQAADVIGADINWVAQTLKAGAVQAAKTDTGHSWRLGPAAVDALDTLWQQHQQPLEGMVTTAEAAAQLGVSRRRVKQMVAEGLLTGHIPDGRCAIWIETASVQRHLPGGRPAAPGPKADAAGPCAMLTTSDAAAALGVSRAVVAALIDGGDLVAVRDTARDSGHFKITAASVQLEQERRAHATGPDGRLKRRSAPPPDGYVDVETAASSLGRTYGTVLRLAADGTIPSVRTASRVFLDAAAVAAGAAAIADAVPLRQAAAELGVEPNTVSALARRGALELALAYCSDRAGAVTRESLDRYVSRTGPRPLRTGQAAARLGVSHDQVRRLIDRGHLRAQLLNKTTFVVAEADVARLAKLGPKKLEDLSAGGSTGSVRAPAAGTGLPSQRSQPEQVAGEVHANRLSV